MQSKYLHSKPFWSLAAIFFFSIPLNYGWEIAQGFLYMGMSDKTEVWWHCFIASLGDGVLVGIVQLIGWCAFGRADWFVGPGSRRYAVMFGSGLVIGIAVEWVAVEVLHRWRYTEQMPLIPGSEIGLIPVLQMILLPPIIFALVGKWGSRGLAKGMRK